jgi:hypothetical protein
VNGLFILVGKISKKLHKKVKKMKYRDEELKDKKCENLAHVAVARYQAFDEANNIYASEQLRSSGRDELEENYLNMVDNCENRKFRKLEANLNSTYGEIRNGDLDGRTAYNTLKDDLKRLKGYESNMVDNAKELLGKLEKSLEPQSAGYDVADFQGEKVLESRTGSRRIGGGSVS